MTASISREIELVNKLGLHARAAAQIATIAAQAQGEVRLCRGGECADAKSTIDILTLACPLGCRLTLIIQYPNDLPILEQIVDLVLQGFGEEQ